MRLVCAGNLIVMSPKTKKFIQSWIINTLAVLVAASIVPGVKYDRPLDLIISSLLLGVLNAFIRPLIMLLALPLLIFTLGLFMLVINAFMLWFVGYLIEGFHVRDFWSAFWGALVIGIISLVLNIMTGSGGARIQIRRGGPRPPRSDGDGGGPVIDV